MVPEDGISAIAVAADAITQMKLLRIDEETTANIGIVQGGQATNIVMPELKIVAEARSLNDAKLEAQVQHMIETFERAAEKHGATVEIESTRAYNAFKLEEDNAHIKRSKRALKQLVLSRKPN